MTPEHALHPVRELPTLDEITELIDLESMRDDNGGHRDATYTIPPAPVRVRRLCRGLSFSSNNHQGDLSCKRNKKTSHFVSARGENGTCSHRPPAQVLLGTTSLSACSGFRIGLLSAPSRNRVPVVKSRISYPVTAAGQRRPHTVFRRKTHLSLLDYSADAR